MSLNDSNTSSTRFLWDVYLNDDGLGCDSNEWSTVSPNDQSSGGTWTPLKMMSIEREYLESENLEYQPCDWSPFDFTFHPTPSEEWEMGAYVYDAVFDATTPSAPKLSPMMRSSNGTRGKFGEWKNKNFSHQRRVRSAPSKKCQLTVTTKYSVKMPTSEPINIKWRNGFPLVHPVSSYEYVQPRQLLFSTHKKNADDSICEEFLNSIDDAIKTFESLTNTTLNLHDPLQSCNAYDASSWTEHVCATQRTNYEPIDFDKCVKRKTNAEKKPNNSKRVDCNLDSTSSKNQPVLLNKENQPCDTTQNANTLFLFSEAGADPLRDLKNAAGNSSITFKFGDNKPKKIKRAALKKRCVSDPQDKYSQRKKIPSKKKSTFHHRSNSTVRSASILHQPMQGYYTYPCKKFGIYVPYMPPMPMQQPLIRSINSPCSSKFPNGVVSILKHNNLTGNQKSLKSILPSMNRNNHE